MMFNRIENIVTKLIGILIVFYMTDYVFVQYYGWANAGWATYYGLGSMLVQLVFAEVFGLKLKLTFKNQNPSYSN